MATADNQRAYYTFNSNNNDSLATYNGTGVNTPTYTSGKLGNALTLVRASSQYVSMPNGVMPWGTNAYTVNMWVKLADTSSNQSFIMTARAGQGIQLYYAGGFITHGKPNVVDLNYSWTADTNWHMWTFVGDGSGMRTYLDGNSTPVATNANTSNIVAPSTDTIEFGAYRLGGSIQAGWYMDGQQDEVGIWDRAITTSEIAVIYNGGTGVTYPFFTAVTLALAQGSYLLTGQSVITTWGRFMSLAQGSYTTTGQALAFSIRLATQWVNNLVKTAISPTNTSKDAGITPTNQTKNTGTWINQIKL